MTHPITEHLRPSPVDFVPGTIEAQKEVIATLTRELDEARADIELRKESQVKLHDMLDAAKVRGGSGIARVGDLIKENTDLKAEADRLRRDLAIATSGPADGGLSR